MLRTRSSACSERPSREALAALVMQCFFVTVGAAGSIADMVATAPALFFFSVVQAGTR